MTLNGKSTLLSNMVVDFVEQNATGNDQQRKEVKESMDGWMDRKLWTFDLLRDSIEVTKDGNCVPPERKPSG